MHQRNAALAARRKAAKTFFIGRQENMNKGHSQFAEMAEYSRLLNKTNQRRDYLGCLVPIEEKAALRYDQGFVNSTIKDALFCDYAKRQKVCSENWHDYTTIWK